MLFLPTTKRNINTKAVIYSVKTTLTGEHSRILERRNEEEREADNGGFIACQKNRQSNSEI